MVKNLMDGAEGEHGLLGMLTETTRELDAVRRLRDHHKGESDGKEEPGGGGGDGMQRGGEDGAGEERECVRKVLEVLKELSVSQSDRMAAWRAALTECAHMLAKPPPGGSDQQRPSTAGT